VSKSSSSPRAIPPLGIITATDLVARELPPVRMVVGNIIPAGLLLLAGDPKVGKSLLCQDLAISIARGGEAWGAFDVQQGQVLYLANEGGERSFRERLIRMLDGEDAPADLHIARSTELLGGHLESQLAWWLAQGSNPRLIVVDTFASVAPDQRGVNRHTEEYKSLMGLSELASSYPDVLIILVHHTNKSNEFGDVMHRISGSNGLTAATDGNAVLSRQPTANQATLTIRPRNAAESELQLQRDPSRLTWTIVEQDERAMLSRSRQRILDYLETTQREAGPKEIAEGTGLSYAAVRQQLLKMREDGQIRSRNRGQYEADTRLNHNQNKTHELMF